MIEVVCAFCGKDVLPSRPASEVVEVREGEKLFHLHCYVLYKRQDKRQAPPPPP